MSGRGQSNLSVPGVSEAVLVIFPGIKEETLCIEVEKMAVIMLIYISKHSGNKCTFSPHARKPMQVRSGSKTIMTPPIVE